MEAQVCKKELRKWSTSAAFMGFSRQHHLLHIRTKKENLRGKKEKLKAKKPGISSCFMDYSTESTKQIIILAILYLTDMPKSHLELILKIF